MAQLIQHHRRTRVNIPSKLLAKDSYLAPGAEIDNMAKEVTLTLDIEADDESITGSVSMYEIRMTPDEAAAVAQSLLRSLYNHCPEIFAKMNLPKPRKG